MITFTVARAYLAHVKVPRLTRSCLRDFNYSPSSARINLTHREPTVMNTANTGRKPKDLIARACVCGPKNFSSDITNTVFGSFGKP